MSIDVELTKLPSPSTKLIPVIVTPGMFTNQVDGDPISKKDARYTTMVSCDACKSSDKYASLKARNNSTPGSTMAPSKLANTDPISLSSAEAGSPTSGAIDGAILTLGNSEGELLGVVDGAKLALGVLLGKLEGVLLGIIDGAKLALGVLLGELEGMADSEGELLGVKDGSMLALGVLLGIIDGLSEELSLGTNDGDCEHS